MRLSLIKNGIPYDVAFCLDDVTVSSYVIIFGELEGTHEFDFVKWKFVERKSNE